MASHVLYCTNCGARQNHEDPTCTLCGAELRKTGVLINEEELRKLNVDSLPWNIHKKSEVDD